MYSIKQLPGRTACINGEEWLYFSGTAYLGTVRHPDFQRWVEEGLARYGTHYGGSRLAAIRLSVFEKAEVRLSEMTGAPATLLLSSGTFAGQLAVRHFIETGYTVFPAPDVHPALWPEKHQPFRGTFEQWADTVRRRKKEAEPIVLLSNALDALHARAYDFSWLHQLPKDRQTILLLDDSHGIGITGPNGEGIFTHLDLPPQVEPVIISSLGKAFGIPAGAILASAERLRELWSSPFFGGASPPNPAFLHAFLQGKELYLQNLRQLRSNVRYLKAALSEVPLFESFDEYPVLYTSDPNLAEYLERHKVLVSYFPYPTPGSDYVTRIVVNSLHQREDLDRLAVLIREYVGG